MRLILTQTLLAATVPLSMSKSSWENGRSCVLISATPKNKKTDILSHPGGYYYFRVVAQGLLAASSMRTE